MTTCFLSQDGASQMHHYDITTLLLHKQCGVRVLPCGTQTAVHVIILVEYYDHSGT